MNRTLSYLLVAAAVGLAVLANVEKGTGPEPTPPAPCPGPVCPVPTPKPAPPKPWGPRRPSVEGEPGKPVLGGKVSPDGSVEITCDLPAVEKKKNVGGRDGSGLCVFTSIEYAARYQNEPRLQNFQDVMRKELGGGWPQKVDAMIKKYGNGAPYLQYEGSDPAFLLSSMKTGRMPAVTYDGRDGVHYSGSIAHMVSLAHIDDRWACITDNNFPGDNQFVWMSQAEFLKRWKGGRQGWAVVLLSPPPPPIPKN